MNGYPAHLSQLIESLKKFPGVGAKSAERFAFHLLDWKSTELKSLSHLIANIHEELQKCSNCGCLIGKIDCFFCSKERSSSQALCIIASSRDAFSIEATREYKGYYHVLGHLISPLDGIGPEKIPLKHLENRIKDLEIKELIIALDSSIEGDATSLYLKQELSFLPIKISRLAFGIPMGSTIDYVDGGTLARALNGRSHF